MESQLERLRRTLMEKAAAQKNLVEVLKDMGISRDNPETIKKLAQEAGISLSEMEDRRKLIEFINQYSRNLSPEVKESIAELYTALAKEMGERLPDDLQDFLAHWKKV